MLLKNASNANLAMVGKMLVSITKRKTLLSIICQLWCAGLPIILKSHFR